jgi:hypothetical protein
MQVGRRRGRLDELREKQAGRRARLEAADRNLQAEIDAILAEGA